MLAKIGAEICNSLFRSKPVEPKDFYTDYPAKLQEAIEAAEKTQEPKQRTPEDIRRELMAMGFQVQIAGK